MCTQNIAFTTLPCHAKKKKNQNKLQVNNFHKYCLVNLETENKEVGYSLQNNLKTEDLFLKNNNKKQENGNRFLLETFDAMNIYLLLYLTSCKE